MPELEFSVYCATCGEGLCLLTTVRNNNVEVEACPRCLERIKDESYDEGYAKGYEDRSNQER